MCIALISTAHPSYPLILIDNRDEFLHRPTAPADWWAEPNSHVLGSRDLARSEHGTWLGVNKYGKIAVLTNYREHDMNKAVGLRSRGSLINSFLQLRPDNSVTTQKYVEDLVSSGDAQLAGGFSLVCGDINGPLAVVSNRVSASKGIPWIAQEKGETVGLSNTSFGDRSWPKIVKGEELMRNALHTSSKLDESEDQLIDRLLNILSTDTLPRLHESAALETYINLLCESIFVPVIGDKDELKVDTDQVASSEIKEKVHVVSNGPSNHTSYMKGLYGTQKQSVVLVHESGSVKFFERTLYDDNAESIPIGEGDRAFKFIPESEEYPGIHISGTAMQQSAPLNPRLQPVGYEPLRSFQTSSKL